MFINTERKSVFLIFSLYIKHMYIDRIKILNRRLYFQINK
jgi:hypothetical protein